MANNDAAQLILGNRTVHGEAQRNEDPRQERRAEDEQPKEGEASVGVAPAPDVDQGGAEGMAEEGDTECGAQEQQAAHGVDEQPGEGGGAATEALLEQA
ncbi:hypothetical protein FH972_023592 [Carpinus fangiana]|uniref:Uncharacterized protein n=1 Tax=Carpinus fangiana TaxID=176857 RepID=A0A5N6KW45_9ROSI|nr:hypothetical protein FH972_023592 [Carpinus fangiana]